MHAMVLLACCAFGIININFAGKGQFNDFPFGYIVIQAAKQEFKIYFIDNSLAWYFELVLG
jgi:hypothetical protein